MAPAVGNAEMRYCGISLFRRLASATRALWPEVPTGGEPHRISCWADAADADIPIRAATTAAAIDRWSMTFPSRVGSIKAAGMARRPGWLANHPSTQGLLANHKSRTGC